MRGWVKTGLLGAVLCGIVPAGAQAEDVAAQAACPTLGVADAAGIRSIDLNAARCQVRADLNESQAALERVADPASGIGVGEMTATLKLAGRRIQRAYPLAIEDSLASRVLDPDYAVADALTALEVPYRRAAMRTTALSGHYGAFAGAAYSLEASGAWDPGFEILLQFENEALVGDKKDAAPAVFRGLCLFNASLWCRRFTDISYQTIGAIDTAQSAAGSSGLGDAGGDGSSLPVDPGGLVDGGQSDGGDSSSSSEEGSLFNPFLKGGGYFRFNTGIKAHFTDWAGLAYGIGVSSVPDAADSDVKLEPRAFAGLNVMTLYGDGAISQMFLGYAYDEFWGYEQSRTLLDSSTEVERVESFNRLVLDGHFMIPRLRARGLGLVGRLYADAPMSGEGPSEVRISLLLHQDFESLFELFQPLQLITSATRSLGL